MYNTFSGNDGLTAEFYKNFSNEVSPTLLDVYQLLEKLGTMKSSRTVVISVIYKKVEKKDIANYRPASFLNLDYKIYTTILKNCMQKTLNGLIGENTSTAVKSKTILHTVSTIRDTVYIFNTLNKQLAAISLDFLKAFNRVDWDFIFSALHKFGYGSKFVHMTQVA